VISASATATRELTWSPHIRENGFSAVNIGTYSHTVIVEHAVLQIRPGMTDEFLLAFSEAKQIIERISGLQSLTLSRCIERAEVFLLLVAWGRIEATPSDFAAHPPISDGANSCTSCMNPFRWSSTSKSSTAEPVNNFETLFSVV
jgi:hypothetical protein